MKVKIQFRVLIRNLMKDLELDRGSQTYVNHRLANEGFTFLTRTLPLLSASVLESLELGYFKRPTNFAWKGASLLYFSSWLDQIFDHKTGLVLRDPCPYSIYRIRQLCDYVYKLTVPMSELKLKVSEAKYSFQEEYEIGANIDQVFLNQVRKNFETLYPEIASANLVTVLQDSSPRYTSGAFNGDTGIYPYYIFKKLPDVVSGTTIKDFNGISGYFRPYKSAKTPVKLENNYRTSKVLFVPKDSRGPRVISKEPLHLLRLQMAYFDFLSAKLEKYSRNRINFASQEINRKLALIASKDKNLATLDLSSASDMMSYKACSIVFRNCPFMRYFFENARSTHTILPSGKTIKLKKLAGMGSGLTFPTMALLIQLCVVTSVKPRVNYSLKEIASKVYVYGDDLIIPRGWFGLAKAGLESAGFKLNTSKCFVSSHFRESCGADYFKGVKVVPVRLKLSNNAIGKGQSFIGKHTIGLTTDNEFNQLYQHTKELYSSHLVNTKRYIDTLLTRCFGSTLYLKTVTGENPCFGLYDDNASSLLTDVKEERLVVQTESMSFKGLCPYKYLGEFFNSPPHTIFNTGTSKLYGTLSKPRSVKIKTRIVPSIAAR